VLQNVRATSTSFNAAICIQSDEFHLPILAALSMFSKNSSSETADSEPDHFGTYEISYKSLCIVGVPIDNRSLSLDTSTLDSWSCA
jgi:hypothetical protein